MSATAPDLAAELTAFRDEHIYPNEARFERELAAGNDRFIYPAILTELRALAKSRGLRVSISPRAAIGSCTSRTQDTPLAALYARLRSLRIVDGPDEVHLRLIVKEELRKRGTRAAAER